SADSDRAAEHDAAASARRSAPTAATAIRRARRRARRLAAPAACRARPRPDDEDGTAPSLARRPQHADVVGIGVAAAAEDGGARDERVGAGGNHLACGLRIDTAIDLE